MEKAVINILTIIILIIISIAVSLALLFTLTNGEKTNNTIEIPTCQEDEVITGVGDFGPDGYWGAYKCEQIDTLFCFTLYHFLELRGPYLNQPPLTNEQIELTNQMEEWYTCFQS